MLGRSIGGKPGMAGAPTLPFRSYARAAVPAADAVRDACHALGHEPCHQPVGALASSKLPLPTARFT